MESIPNAKEKPVFSEETLPVNRYGIGSSIELDIVGENGATYEANYKAASRFTAELLADTIARLNEDKTKRRIVLGLAADTSPIGMYEEFAKIREERNLDLSKVFVVRYEQAYGSDVSKGSDLDFDAFHEKMFFAANGIEPMPATIAQTPQGKIVEGNFLPMFEEYESDEDKEKVQKVADNIERILKLVGSIDFAVVGIGKDGHIIDWGRFEKGFHIRETREKTPEEYDRGYERFEGNAAYRNYMWEDILELAEELTGQPKEQLKKGLRTTATLGIRHIIMANELVLIAPQATKAEAVKEAVYGSVTEDLVDCRTGTRIRSLVRDKNLRNPAASVISVRNIAHKKTRLITTPQSASELSL